MRTVFGNRYYNLDNCFCATHYLEDVTVTTDEAVFELYPSAVAVTVY